MIYKDFRGLKLSALGLGTMRLPVIDGQNGRIDEEATAKMVALALEKGINYFDTAWMYHEYTSEVVVGKVLKQYPRDSFYLATKFPGMNPQHRDDPSIIFEKQLEKCQVDYFDFYLIHNLNEKSIDAYLDDNDKVMPYLLEQKAKGRIRHLGLSAHSTTETLRRFLDKWGEHIEFCQIQLNYIDWNLQRANERVALLNERNVAIWVMEPLRGGKLATLSEANTAKLNALRPEEGIPAWGFRYLQSIPGVTMVLSGMSNEQQLLDNIATFSEDKPLNEAEMGTLLEIAEEMSGGVPCTACRYCTTVCPMGLDIPNLLQLYNEYCFSNSEFIAHAVSDMHKEKRPSACLGCRACERMCPQNIKIASVLADFDEKLTKK